MLTDALIKEEHELISDYKEIVGLHLPLVSQKLRSPLLLLFVLRHA